MGCVKTAPVWLAAPVAGRATEGEGPEGGGIMGGWLQGSSSTHYDGPGCSFLNFIIPSPMKRAPGSENSRNLTCVYNVASTLYMR